jgi:shikimate dehydrogenase
VAYALASAGTSITILNRTLSRAESLVADLASLFPSILLRSLSLSPDALRQEVPPADLLINTTSLGMWPQTERSPWPDEIPLPVSLTVFDLVYNPLETKLMRQSRGAGARAIGGLEMLVYQGVAAWELWTGQKAPVEVMMTAAKVAL